MNDALSAVLLRWELEHGWYDAHTGVFSVIQDLILLISNRAISKPCSECLLPAEGQDRLVNYLLGPPINPAGTARLSR
jgi:hypothetical protein